MAKHEKTFVNYDRPYETNLIGLRGVIYFGVGLFLLVVITFGLMLFLRNIMEEQLVEKDVKEENPMAMSDKERLRSFARLRPSRL